MVGHKIMPDASTSLVPMAPNSPAASLTSPPKTKAHEQRSALAPVQSRPDPTHSWLRFFKFEKKHRAHKKHPLLRHLRQKNSRLTATADHQQPTTNNQQPTTNNRPTN